MRLTFLIALSIAAFAADAPPASKPLTTEQKQALEIIDLKFQRDSALMEKLTAQINQYRAEYQALTTKACADAGFTECTVANGTVTEKKRVEVAAKPTIDESNRYTGHSTGAAKPAPAAKEK